MKVTFTYINATGGTRSEVLSDGRRLTPTQQAGSISGLLQIVERPRQKYKEVIGRGNASVEETFIGWKEHANYWAAVTYCRVTLKAMAGRRGTLIFDSDSAGRLQLTGAGLSVAHFQIIGLATAVTYQFIGQEWTA